MTDWSKLLALAEAVAQGKGRDVPLNHEVGSAMHGLGWHPADCLLDFTGSIDGAARVVPANSLWNVGTDIDGPYARVLPPVGNGWTNSKEHYVLAATTPLALLSSALRAQAEALA